MDDNSPSHTTTPPSKLRSRIGKSVMLGAAASLALLAGWSLLRTPQKSRRYTDHAQDRRNPLSMFAGGDHPRRRLIDHSGTHPLFERRESVYETYDNRRPQVGS